MPFIDLESGVADLFARAQERLPTSARSVAISVDPSFERSRARARAPERWRAAERRLLAEIAADL